MGRALLGLLLIFCPNPVWSAQGFPSIIEVEEETSRHTVFEVRFPSEIKTRFEPNTTVWGHLYIPKETMGSGLPPVVLALPIMAAPNVWIEMRFVHAFLRKGIAVFLLEMPYQFHRVPKPLVPSGQVFLARKAGKLGANFRQSISDARRAITWLEGSGKVDPKRIGLFGVSLGAIVSASVYSRDSRPRAAVLMLGGADFPDLVFKGDMTAEFVENAGITKDEMVKAWEGLDPLEYKEANKGKTVFLINAKWDRVIPPENARKLKEAFPDSKQLWVPLGHYGSILHLVWVPSYVARKFVKYFQKR